MNGRSIFEKYKAQINIISLIFNMLPLVISRSIYKKCCHSDSKISIFIRYLYVKKHAKHCGTNIYIGPNVILKGVEELRLSDNISIHAFSYLDATGGLEIEENTSVAAHSCIYTFEHSWSDKEKPIKYNEIIFKKVHIEKDVWIGAHSVILGGVTIEHRSVVAAGAVVNRKVNSGTLVGGVPAKLIKNIN